MTLVRPVILAVLMLAASLGAVAMRPTYRIADQGPRVNLEAMIPKSFADWRDTERGAIVVADPGVTDLINKIYNQILTRTYVNSDGYRIMLSIAYGGDQSDELQVHRPEVCYARQGFQVLSEQHDELATSAGHLPIKRVLTSQGPRVEPVTYWIVVGGNATRPGLRNKLTRLAFGLTGKIPDGMLVRVSSIDTDVQRAYQIHAAFLNDMLGALGPDARLSIIGHIQRQ